jgi:hypothetical protein
VVVERSWSRSEAKTNVAKRRTNRSEAEMNEAKRRTKPSVSAKAEKKLRKVHQSMEGWQSGCRAVLES